MKLVSAILLTICLMVPVSAQSGGKQKQEARKSPNSFVSVDKPQSVPQRVKKGFESITSNDEVAYLTFLASDLLAGRDTGSKEYSISAQFAATLFKTWGLKAAGDMPTPVFSMRSFMNQNQSRKKPQRGYLQQVELKEIVGRASSAKVESRIGQQYKALMFDENIDYQYTASKSQVITAPVVFVGYGINEKSLKYNDYKGIDVKGKIVLMLSETPRSGKPDNPFAKGKLKAKYFPQRRLRRRMGGNPKSQLAGKQGAVAILMVENNPAKADVAERVISRRRINDERPIIPGQRRRITLVQADGRMSFGRMPTLRISRQMAQEILKLAGQDLKSIKTQIEKDLKPRSTKLKGISFTVKSKVKTKLLNSPNVLAYIEGSDAKLKDEVVVIGAHLDHLGKRGDYIFNGADDNGSGSAAVLEIAQAFSVNDHKPKRSVLFALWTGEEKGLLGSRYYVVNPYFPLKKTVAYLNLDMLSRKWDKKRLTMMGRFMGVQVSKKDLKNLDMAKFISLSFTGGNPGFNKLIMENNQYVGMSLLLRESSPSIRGGGGSDHMSFGMNKVPWAFFIAGMTEVYHQPTDTVDKICPELMLMGTRLTYLLADALANQ